MNIEDFAECESLEGITDTTEKICTMMALSKRYDMLSKLLKETANDLAYSTDDSAFDMNNIVVRKKSRTTSKVNQEMLRMSYSDVYDALYNDGKLIAKAEDLKKYEIPGVVTQSTSNYLQIE